jgi:hypothetical protein
MSVFPNQLLLLLLLVVDFSIVNRQHLACKSDETVPAGTTACTSQQPRYAWGD